MNRTTLDPGHVIDQMITLRLQLAELEQQIDSLKPAFFAACAAQDLSQFKHEQAVISRRLTPGRWNYPDDILGYLGTSAAIKAAETTVSTNP